LAEANPLLSACFQDALGRRTTLVPQRREDHSVDRTAQGTWRTQPVFA
jgi:hypothetical protein